MESILALGKYGGSDSEDSDSGINENALISQPAHLTQSSRKNDSKKTMAVVAAPTVITKYDVSGNRHVDVSKGKTRHIFDTNSLICTY